jgi:hypothetical protein
MSDLSRPQENIKLLAKHRLMVAFARSKAYTPAMRLVAINLIDCLNTRTGLCCPKNKTLADVTGVTTRCVQMTIKAVMDDGLVWQEMVDGRAQYRFKGIHQRSTHEVRTTTKKDDVVKDDTIAVVAANSNEMLFEQLFAEQ